MNDLKNVYSDFALDVRRYFKALPQLIVCWLAYGVLTTLTGVVISRIFPINILGSLVDWLVRMFIFTHFATVMDFLFLRDELRWKDLKEWDVRYLAPLTQIFFFLWLAELVLDRMFGIGLPMFGVFNLSFLVTMAWEVLSAPAYETVYLGHEVPVNVFPNLARFWRVNWLPLLPFTVVAVVIYLAAWKWFLLGGIPSLAPEALVARLILAVTMALYYFGKALLFRILYFSTPRSRAFHSRVG